MVNPITCPAQSNQELSSAIIGTDPYHYLLDNYSELLVERVVIDTDGEEIHGRLKGLIQRASADAQENQQAGEPFARAVIRNALRRLNYNFCQTTLGGLATGPAYERAMPDIVSPQNFGHEKVPYPMSDYDQLSYLPVGGLGAPLYEIDNTTFYLRTGHMIQDPIESNNITVSIGNNSYDLANTEGTYYALYPYSERSYNLDIPISVMQFSPVIPGNYISSSMPVEMIELIAHNPTNKPIDVTFTVSRENILGWRVKDGKNNPKNPNAKLAWVRDSKNNYSESFNTGNTTGIVFKQKGDQRKLVRDGMGLAGQIALVSNSIPGQAFVSENTSGNVGTLNITLTLQPGETIKHPVVVAYDNPFYLFQKKVTDPKSHAIRMPKFYTNFYSASGQNAKDIAQDALNNFASWKGQIDDFQDTIINDPALPNFFKQALLNELYILPETGIWEADQGRFAYLESIDYKMYNTSDVNSYTWAILALFPKLEKSDLLEFGRLVPLHDPTRHWKGTDRWTNTVPSHYKDLYWGPAKEAGTVCHDLGGFQDNGLFPFTNTCNGFNWSNANMWIDLAPKFALRTWRYYMFVFDQTGKRDIDFIKTIYPSVKMSLDTLENRWADKITHVPKSKGIPDWTYDTISGKGYTPNVVTQWLGALEAAQKMAALVGDDKTLDKYIAWYDAGKKVLAKLWNDNGYYNAFSALDNSEPNTNIHSDMLFGDFYARITDLDPVVPNDRAAYALNTIYSINGEAWSNVGNHGPLGLVNLRGFDGAQNKTEQGDEGWTGAMLLNAAYQIRLGKETNNQQLVENGWKIVHGFYNVVYSNSPDSQHWFGRTPEGYVNPDDFRYNNKKKRYGMESGRAPKYMRALAIWAVYAAIKNNQMPFDIYSPKPLNLVGYNTRFACMSGSPEGESESMITRYVVETDEANTVTMSPAGWRFFRN
ncbi:MAG: GH116 family glycosyl hydrolase [Candidatus Margulisiibacteriota bacterium]|nr:GH116 family glycosyl hydrolase [Candidatus Margulisiibacteriota bacterium]